MEGVRVRIAREDGTTPVSRLHHPLEDNQECVESGDNIPVLGVNDSDNTTTSIPSLVGPTVPEPMPEFVNRFQDDTVRRGGENRRNNWRGRGNRGRQSNGYWTGGDHG